MEQIEIAGLAGDTALRLAPAHDGTLALSVLNRPDRHTSVILRPGWVLPLAAWFAGEATPVAIGDDRLFPYAASLAVHGDEVALVYSTHAEAWLRCSEPYGTARVVVGPRGHMVSASLVVLLSPDARQQAATALRRAHAEHRAESVA